MNFFKRIIFFCLGYILKNVDGLNEDSQIRLLGIIDIEKELGSLKKYIRKNEDNLSEDVIDRLKYILEDIKEIQK